MASLRFTREQINETLISLSIFVSSITFFTSPFEGYFHYLIFLLLFPYFISRYGWKSLGFKFTGIPFVFGCANIFLGNCEVFGFVKIYGGMLLSINFYHYVFIHYDFDFKRIFKIYLNGIIICCYIGIIEIICYRLKLSIGYDYRWVLNKWDLHQGGFLGIRMNSIFSEPSQFAIVLLPAVFISVQHLLMRNFVLLTLNKCVIVLACLVLTTSSTGFIGIFASFLVISINQRRFFDLVILFLLVVGGFYVLYKFVPDFTSRIDASLNLWEKDTFAVEDINNSSFVLYNNYHVSIRSLSEHPILGNGLGSYPLVYEKYSLTREADFLIKKGFDFNSQDGNSLLFRTIAEMGIIGLVFWFVFIPRNFVRKNFEDPDDISWVYSGACLTLILGFLVRQGNYFINGFPFFVLFYYFLHQRHKSGIIIKQDEEDDNGKEELK